MQGTGQDRITSVEENEPSSHDHQKETPTARSAREGGGTKC